MRICASRGALPFSVGSVEDITGSLERLAALKKKANAYFGAQRYQAAAALYSQALQEAEAAYGYVRMTRVPFASTLQAYILLPPPCPPVQPRT